jgi:hypothetical protein
MNYRNLINFILLSIVLTLTACVSNPELVKTSENNYTLTRIDKGGSFGNLDDTRHSLVAEANKFAESQGKVAVRVSMKDTPMQIEGYTSVEYKFQLMSKLEADTLVTESANNAAISSAKSTGTTVVQPTGPNAMYDALIKLDDLHKRGILTDEEFASQKKKILDRN